MTSVGQDRRETSKSLSHMSIETNNGADRRESGREVITGSFSKDMAH
ncbi:MAG: hypothetical protein JSR31_03760 [Nitrospira sp.]|nr:hypothetical protein [Nitrospira sp.]